MAFIIILLAVPVLVTTIDFISFLITGRRLLKNLFLKVIEVWAMVVLPFLYASFGNENDCCSGEMSAPFSLKHQLTIKVLILLCLSAYFYSGLRTRLAPPIMELVVNALLVICIALNIVIAIHTADFWIAAIGNVPIILLTIMALVKNYRLFIGSAEQSFVAAHSMEKIAWKILRAQPFIKYPIIAILCLPVLIFLIALLLLFGQKADSLIRAFTDTYHHGLSQWDYQCANIHCGGHFLCSVAANGHAGIVKPKRLGVRNGQPIKCNRQLLIANAFEDLLEEHCPLLHSKLRKQYNKVGNLIHRYYSVFNNKLLSDVIYLIMKPLEWLFLIALYTLNRQPENRIAKQYISSVHRQQIEKSVKA